MYITKHDGILFLENLPPGCQTLKPIKVEIGGIFTSAQLKSLNDVKSLMAIHAREAGANAIVNFKYGQKSASWFQSLLQRDDVNWYGSGTAAIVTGKSNQEQT